MTGGTSDYGLLRLDGLLNELALAGNFDAGSWLRLVSFFFDPRPMLYNPDYLIPLPSIKKPLPEEECDDVRLSQGNPLNVLLHRKIGGK
jgi:hypothetical protein